MVALILLKWRKSKTQLNKFMYSTRRKIGCNEYYLNNNMGILNVFATGYSQIIIRNVERKDIVIYEVDFTERIKTVILPILVIICSILATLYLLKVHRGLREKENTGDGSVC